MSLVVLALLAHLIRLPSTCKDDSAQKSVTTEHAFETHDGHAMFGKLTLPQGDGPHPVVVYVQAAEGMTVDMKRPKPGGGTFNYFDLYAEKLPPLGVGFFRYEGRGIRMGTEPPRYEEIEREVYNTSTLDNKVLDVLAAVALLKESPGVDPSRIYLLGASEGTLLAAKAAASQKDAVAGLILYGAMSGTLRDLFRFIMTDGAYLAYCGYFDTDEDGIISSEEFEADANGYRASVFPTAPFSAFDKDQDGFFRPEEMPELTRPYLDAIDQENYTVLDQWAKTSAGVSTPEGWFKNHFEHDPIWTFLSELDVPVGFFHGDGDSNAPIEGVRELEQRARAEGLSKMEFHYFEGLDHSLGIMHYFTKGELPEGHVAIFDFISRLTASETVSGRTPGEGR